MRKRTSTFSASSQPRHPALPGTALALLSMLAAHPIAAAPYTYMGNSPGTATTPSNGNFSDGFDAPITSGSTTYADSLNFGGSTDYTATDDISTLNVNSLNFTNSGAVTLASTSVSNVLSLGGTSPAVNLNNIGALTINLNLSLAANMTFGGSGSATLNGAITGNSRALVLGTTSAPFTGVLTLTGANTYSGGTSINGGILNFTNGALSTTGDIRFGGGTLQYASGNTQDISSRLVNSTGAITVDTNGNNVTFGNTLGSTDSGGLTKNGLGKLTLTGSNGYLGPTTINSGILSVTKLADGGNGSGSGLGNSLGKSTSAAANLILNGGTLQYAGTINSTTNRLFTLGTQGGTLDASGTGSNTVTFTGTGAVAFSTPDSPETLTLTGTNSGNNTLAAKITDNGSGQTSLTKSGDGTWVLTNANTYTGGTTVNGGTLAIGAGSTSAGSISSGALAINNTNTGVTATSVVIDFNAASGTLHTVTSLSSTVSGTSGNTATIRIESGNALTDAQNGTTNYAGSVTGGGTLNIGGQSSTHPAFINYTGTDSAAQTNVGANATLQLNNSGGPALSGPVAVATGGVLTIRPNSTNDQIATAAPPVTPPAIAAVTLNGGGTLNANGSDGTVDDPTRLATANVTQSMGALALGSNSTLANPSLLNLGAGTTANPLILAFADSSSTLMNGYLNVINYTGSTNALYVGTTASLMQSELNRIAYNGLYGAFMQLNNGQLVLSPAPEPSGAISSLLGAGGLGWLVFLRRRRTAKAV